MSNSVRSLLFSTLLIMLYVLIVVATVKIVAVYVDYFPPNFSSDFLMGREAKFFGSYQWAFYVHILSGPWTLLFGGLLLNNQFRMKFPKWHARLGKVQVALILMMLVPSGFWMAFYAQAGLSVQVGFASLALLTALSAIFGWSCAVQRKFQLHRIWMLRCYVLLSSAIVTRVIGGTMVTLGIEGDWTHYFPAWVNWIVPLVLFELISFTNSKRQSVRLTIPRDV